VLWLPYNGGTLGAPRALATGFRLANRTRWGRPVDAVPGPDGALYVTDEDAGAVYRLVPPG
jgi:glucose/arabinose dehydrogenase